MDNILDIIKSEFTLRVITESLSRIERCLGQLSHEEIWDRKNENTNSVGNLVLHLEGNIRQYIISGVGGAPDTRIRDDEFKKHHNQTAEALLAILTPTLKSSNEVVQALTTQKLSEKVVIQGFPHTRLSAIIHVIEHLSYHVGQITYYTKYIKDVDTAYYGGLDLNVTS